jgi:transcriptional regulator with GAF, ATPase, and Fis domain
MPQGNDLNKLSLSLQDFDKENLSDILHFTATGLKQAFKSAVVRIYLEDLYEGMLVCHYVTGQDHPSQNHINKYISQKESLVSKAFNDNSVSASWDLQGGLESSSNPFEKISGIKTSVAFPITFQMRPIGVVSLDWNEEEKFLSKAQIETILEFLVNSSLIIERAKRYRQNISFSRHLDRARKKEAAWLMVRSAVNLIEKLTLASVLVPKSHSTLDKRNSKTSDLVEILSVFSKNGEDADVYKSKDSISIMKGRNLINSIVKYDKEKGLIANSVGKKSVYIDNVLNKQFSRKPIASKVNLISLYQVPKFNKETKQFICAVNYYTSESYKFTKFDERLLQEHASMVEKLILEENPTHIEIEVLSEIEELLSAQNDSLASFLHKILDKTSELINADCGTISLLKQIDSKPWLIVEGENNKIIGAKSRGWKKNRIPLLQVGGNDLPDESKSLNGYCAHTARPVLINNVNDINQTQGFYKNLSKAISSELAVPIIFENNVLGVINQDSFQVNHFTQEHKKILQIIATLIGQKVFNLQQIEEIRQETLTLKQDIEYRDPKVSSYYLGNVIGKSRKINGLVNQIDTVIDSICSRMLHWESNKQKEALIGLPALLITGRTGTGKEFFFNNIYSRITEIFQKEKGPDAKLPLRKTNIAAYSGELTYSELFGHKKGAYTGAETNRKGILEEANGGIVFLDEIGDADPKTQVQLLRFLDTGVFMRLGENRPCYSSIFLVAATNKNLLEEIEEGRFREDLYHRLNALSFKIPSLDERREDIEDLATHFLGRLSQTYYANNTNKGIHKLDDDALKVLTNHNYRGNVRELKNILLRAMLFSKSSTLTGKDLTAALNNDVDQEIKTNNNSEHKIYSILDELEKGEGDFWTHIYQPFKDNRMTRDTLKIIIQTAKSRYQTNLPGIAIKLGVCNENFRDNAGEHKKFTSFKNFIYKTVKLSSN